MEDPVEALFRPHGPKTPPFNLAGVDTFARVVAVHDGDTLTAVIPLAFKSSEAGFYRFSVRLEGIDTCEMKASSEVNAGLARRARARLLELVGCCEGDPKFLESHVCIVRLVCGKFDKYGRLLAKVYARTDHSTTESESFNDRLVSERLACVYQGKTKMTEAQQRLHLIGTSE
jgi:endonuclease YncB( thermonuclease family)